MKSQKYFITFLIFVVVTAASVLLVAQRFETPHQSAWVGDFEYRRGETVSSNDGFLKMIFGDAQIFFDVNTVVKIIDGREGEQTINVIQGRVVVNGPMTITTREVKTHIDGVASFVHYSWLDEIEIASLSGSAQLLSSGQEEDVSGRALTVHTLPPYEIVEANFDPTASSATNFYAWVFEE